jgi:hypothetical protein
MLHEYHVIYSIQYYPWFHVTAVGLGMNYPWIQGTTIHEAQKSPKTGKLE